MLLKGKRSPEPSPGCPPGLGTTSTTGSCSAVGCSHAVPCLGSRHTGRGASPHCASHSTACPGLSSPPSLKQTWPGPDCQGAAPHLGGLAAELEPSSPLGLSSVLGAAVRNTSPSGRVMGEGRLCHSCELSITSSASRADVPVGVQSCWICLGEGVTGFVGGQGLFTVKTYNLLCPLNQTQSIVYMWMGDCGSTMTPFPCCWCVAVLGWGSLGLWRRQTPIPASRVTCLL